MKYSTIALSLAAAMISATPVLAATAADIAADQRAIDKDNAALHRDHKKLERDRAAKADAKEDGRAGDQAASSVAIAKDKAEIQEKSSEKNVDQQIMDHDENHLNPSAQ